jgi:hypothetical protein
MSKYITNGICPLDRTDCEWCSGGSTTDGFRCTKKEVEVIERYADWWCNDFEVDLGF